MANIKDDLRWNVLRRSAKSVGPVPGLQSLDEAKVREFYVAVLLDEYVLGLEVTVDQVLSV